MDILLQKALDNSLNKYSENEILAEEIGNKIIDEIMKQITPWIVHKSNLKKIDLNNHSKSYQMILKKNNLIYLFATGWTVYHVMLQTFLLL